MGAEVVDRDHGWKKLFQNIREIRAAHVKVGILADSEKGGMHVAGGKLTVAEIAAVNEFGTEDGRVPARSFVRSTFDEEREELVEFGSKLIEAVLDGKMDTRRALGLMGLKLADKIKAKITSNVPPPNAPSTVAKKSRGKVGQTVKTLIDTGRMLGAVTWAVVTGKGE